MKSFAVNNAPAMGEDRIYVINKITEANPHLISAFTHRSKFKSGGEANFPCLLFEIAIDKSNTTDPVQTHTLVGLFPNEPFASAAMVGMAQQYGGRHDRIFLLVQFYEGKLHALSEHVWAEHEIQAAA